VPGASAFAVDFLMAWLLGPPRMGRRWPLGKQRFLGQIWNLGNRLKDIVPRCLLESADLDRGLESRRGVDRLGIASEVAIAVDERRSFHGAIAQLPGFAAKMSAYLKEMDGSTERTQVVAHAFQAYLKMLGLFAPHLAETLWRTVTGSPETFSANRGWRYPARAGSSC